MMFIFLGTIGHVAHGKSTLVKAISGVQVTPAPAVNRCLLPAGRLAANPPYAVAAVDRRDRQTA